MATRTMSPMPYSRRGSLSSMSFMTRTESSPLRTGTYRDRYLSNLPRESHLSTKYVPTTMSRTRQPSTRSYQSSTTYSDSYKDRYSNGTLGSTVPRYTTTSRFTAPSRGLSTYSSTYGTGSTTATRLGGGSSTLTRVSSPRPLPSGPGPLDEYGHKMDIHDSLLRSKHTGSTTLSNVRSGPVKSTYLTSSRTASPVLNDTGVKHTLSPTKRTSSITNLTADLDNLHVGSGTSSTSNTTLFGRSKRFGSQADISAATRTLSPERAADREDLYDTGSRMTVTKNYYNAGSHLYDYKDTEHSEATVLPDIHKTGRTSRSPSHDRLKDDDARPVRRISLTNGSRQNSCDSYNSRRSPETTGPNGLVGLKNLGNTCFMNSVLQCLSITRQLRDYCLSDEFRDDINKSTSSMKGALIIAYAKLMKLLWKGGSETYVSPTEFKSQIQKFAPRFVGYNQQDAQEILIYLLEGLHEDVNRVVVKKKNIITENDDGEEKISASEKATQTWKRYLERDNSKIVDLFVGQLKSALRCTNCGYVSNTFDPFWDLSLPIKKRGFGEVSLSDCFDLFTQEEVLDGDEKPTCARCKTRRKCTKSFSIQRFPKVLIIHLKRFNQESYLRSKLSTLVDFPLKDLDLSKYAAEKNQAPFLYTLYAVANHSGTPFSGHYTAYTKRPKTGDWHYFSDTRVSSISSSQIKSSEAYVLFYELTSGSHPARL